MDKKQLYHKEYNAKYKDKNRDKFTQMIICESCNCSVQQWNLHRHHKSMKHIKSMESKEDKLQKAVRQIAELQKILDDLKSE